MHVLIIQYLPWENQAKSLCDLQNILMDSCKKCELAQENKQLWVSQV